MFYNPWTASITFPNTPQMIDMRILVSVLDQYLDSVLASFRDEGSKFTGKFKKPYDDLMAVYKRLDIAVKMPERKGKKPYGKWRLDIPSLESIAEPLSQLFFGGMADASFVSYNWVKNYKDTYLGWAWIPSKRNSGNGKFKGSVNVVLTRDWDSLKVPKKWRTCSMIETTLHEQIHFLEYVCVCGMHFKNVKHMRCGQKSEAQKLACKLLQLNMHGPRTLRAQVPGYQPVDLEYSNQAPAGVAHGPFFQVVARKLTQVIKDTIPFPLDIGWEVMPCMDEECGEQSDCWSHCILSHQEQMQNLRDYHMMEELDKLELKLKKLPRPRTLEK